MSRHPVTLREATTADVPFLVELWSGVLRKADRQDQVQDLELIVKESAESAERRLIVAEYDGQPAGAVYLRVSTISALNLEPYVQALSPHVSPSYRRKGIGSALMESAVSWAEELGIGTIGTAVTASSRAANRFMARLSLGPRTVQRASSTHAVRARLTAMGPVSPLLPGRRPIGPMLAARRAMRRTGGTDAP
jgi:GNAT superfamily N-acetyltransferase